MDRNFAPLPIPAASNPGIGRQRPVTTSSPAMRSVWLCMTTTLRSSTRVCLHFDITPENLSPTAPISALDPDHRQCILPCRDHRAV